MSNRYTLAALPLLLCLPGVLDAQEPATFECRYGELRREVAVSYLAPPEQVPCVVEYRKPTEGGAVETPWRADNEAGYCEFKANELVEKLESWGWDCGSSEEPPAESPAEP